MNSEFEFDQEFFSAARKGLRSLSEQDRAEIKEYIEGALCSDGYFVNESGESDLYISAFGIMLSNLLSIDKAAGATAEYLRSKGDGEGLDFLHVASLTRAWRFFSHDSLEIGSFSKIAEKLEYNHCADKLWNQANGTHFGSVYGTYLAISSYQNLGLSVPDESKLVEPMKNLRSKDGAFGTDRGAENGTTPSTSFAALILNFIEESNDFEISWLLKQQHSDGGFLAISQMPFSDIQSTVYVIMALAASCPEKLSEISQGASKFIHSMKVKGGFRGHLKEEKAGIENTIFALAGLGFLA